MPNRRKSYSHYLLDCIGLPLHDPAYVHGFVLSHWHELRGFPCSDGSFVAEWREPSGASLGIVIREGVVYDVTPGFAGGITANLANVTRLGDGSHVLADVIGADGDLATRFCADLAQWPAVPRSASVDGEAIVSGLAVRLSVYDDAVAFERSDDAVLRRDAAPALRMGAQSFLPAGMFAAAPQPTAWLAGTVREAWTLEVVTTGREFDCARVETVGFDVYVCWPSIVADNALPGNTVCGEVYLTVSMPSLGP